MKKSLPEIFDEIKKAETVDAKKKIIKDEYSVSVAAVLKMQYDPTIKLKLPAGLPDDYKFNSHPYNSFERMIRSIPPLVELPEGAKLERAWLRVLTPLSKEEVLFATALKDKELDLGLTLADVRDLFPTLFANVTPEVLEQAETAKTAESKSQKVDDQGSKTPEPGLIPDDPYGDKFKPSKVEEDPTIPPIEGEGSINLNFSAPSQEVLDELKEIEAKEAAGKAAELAKLEAEEKAAKKTDAKKQSKKDATKK